MQQQETPITEAGYRVLEMTVRRPRTVQTIYVDLGSQGGQAAYDLEIHGLVAISKETFGVSPTVTITDAGRTLIGPCL